MSRSNNFLSQIWQNLENNPEKNIYHQIGNIPLAPLSYAKLDYAAVCVAKALQQHGLQPYDRVMVMQPQPVPYMISFFGCLYAQGIAVPVYLPAQEHHLNKMLMIQKDSGAKFLITDSQSIQLILTSKFYHEFQNIILLDYAEIIQQQYENNFIKHYPRSDAIAFLQYTSGSTGNPKGVIVKYENLYANLNMCKKAFAIQADSILMSWLPLFHDMGLICNALLSPFTNIPIFLLPTNEFVKNPFTWLEAISVHRTTHSFAPNIAYEICTKKISVTEKAKLDLSSWQMALNGAEPIRLSTLEQFKESFQVCGLNPNIFVLGYGQAEATVYVSSSSMNTAIKYEKLIKHKFQEGKALLTETSPYDVALSCGTSDITEKVIIVDPKTCINLPLRHIGEIWLQGPNVCQGYWNNSELSEKVFRAYTAEDQIGPFLRTGDLGYLNEEGELFITGRIKDVIIRYGRNYYPQDIEHTVEQCHPFLRPGGSTALSIEKEGKELLAIISEVQPAFSLQNVSEIILAIQNNVYNYNELRTDIIVLIPPKTINKTTSGKIQRNLMRNLLITNELNSIHVWNRNDEDSDESVNFSSSEDAIELEKWIINWVAKKLVLDAKFINPNQNLAAFAIDSVQYTELSLELERYLDVRLNLIENFTRLTITDLCQALLSLKDTVK